VTTPVATHIVSLERRTDRRSRMQARLDRHGIAARFFPAIDAATTDAAVLAAGLPPACRAWPMLPGEMACALSHRGVWDHFLAGDASALCVLEDDVVFGEALAALLADARWVTPGHGIVKLDLNSQRGRQVLVTPSRLAVPRGELWRLWSRRLGGGGYIAHREIVARLVAARPRAAVPVDHLLFNPVHAPLFGDPGVHVILPAPVFHDHEGSDLASARAARMARPDAPRIRLAREIENLSAFQGRVAAWLRGARYRPFETVLFNGE
jgi:glycosyl transferase family 25